MADRIFLRDVSGYKAGEIYPVTDHIRIAHEQNHGVDLDEHSLLVEEAARRYVISLQKDLTRTARTRSSERDS